MPKNICNHPSFNNNKKIVLSEHMVLSSLHYRQKSKVADFLSKSLSGDADYEEQAYTCPKCNRFHSRLYVKVISDWRVFETLYKCNKCRTRLVPLDIEKGISDCRCSMCGEKGLASSFGGHWD